MAMYIGDTSHPYNPPQTYGSNFSPFAQQFVDRGSVSGPAATPVVGSGTPGASLPGQNPATLATDTASGNIAALPDIGTLTGGINDINISNQQKLNASRLGPQGQQIQDTLLNNTQRQAQGLLDPETEQMLQQGIAQSGIGSGMGVDSANLASAYRRALGIDINAVEQQGLQNYGAMLSDNPSAPLYNAGESVVSPGQYSTTGDQQQRIRLADQQQQIERDRMALEAWLAMQNRGGGGGYRGGGGSSYPSGGSGGGAASYNPSIPGYMGTSGSGGSGAPSYDPSSGTYNPYDPTGGLGDIPGFSSSGTGFDTSGLDQTGVPGSYPPGAPTLGNQDQQFNEDWLSGNWY